MIRKKNSLMKYITLHQNNSYLIIVLVLVQCFLCRVIVGTHPYLYNRPSHQMGEIMDVGEGRRVDCFGKKRKIWELKKLYPVVKLYRQVIILLYRRQGARSKLHSMIYIAGSPRLNALYGLGRLFFKTFMQYPLYNIIHYILLPCDGIHVYCIYTQCITMSKYYVVGIFCFRQVLMFLGNYFQYNIPIYIMQVYHTLYCVITCELFTTYCVMCLIYILMDELLFENMR